MSAAAAAFTRQYYSDRATRFGATPLGVDWTCAMTQRMRFVQLLRLQDGPGPHELADLGCGYGALLDHLLAHDPAAAARYRGIDLSPQMIALARARHPHHAERFHIGTRPPAPADYTLASGIFNVQHDGDRADWEAMIEHTLGHLAAASRRGFAVNLLWPRPGAPPGLYATTPDRWTSHCRSRFDAAVEVLDGYGLAEFTVLVRPADPSAPNSAWARSSSG